MKEGGKTHRKTSAPLKDSVYAMHDRIVTRPKKTQTYPLHCDGDGGADVERRRAAVHDGAGSVVVPHAGDGDGAVDNAMVGWLTTTFGKENSVCQHYVVRGACGRCRRHLRLFYCRHGNMRAREHSGVQ